MEKHSYCKLHDTYPTDDEPCWACVNQFSDMPLDGEAENRQNTKPCRVDGKTPCVQYPEEDCGCDPCEECEIAIIYKEMKDEH